MLRDPRLVFETVTLQSGIFLLDAATLWCTGRAVGLNAVGSAFMSFILASVVATLSPIPLGLGSFEGTCTGLLHLMGGGLEASLAATLILRGLTLWLPMLPGLVMIRREAVKPAIIRSAR
jgi:glycosyltransferase 2 family protein